jgi:histidine triad (HIT) family protein
MVTECVFCEIMAGRAPGDIVYQDDLTVAFIDPRQHNPGHVLVVPRTHINDIRELDPRTGAGLMDTLIKIAIAVTQAFPSEGMSLWHAIGPAAFQEVPHMHMHVHPRRLGDGLLRVYPGPLLDADPVVRASYAERLRSALAEPGERKCRSSRRYMSDTFEGDLIRPLGVVTLNFGYLEYELDSFLERLASAELVPASWRQRPIGQKLSLLSESLRTLDARVHSGLDTLLDEIQGLLEQRNALVHSCIVAGGRVVSGRSGVDEARTSPEELTSLAEKAFTWKERLWAYRWKQVEPQLAAISSPARTK